MTNHIALTRSEYLALIDTSVRGLVAGATRAIITWLLAQLGT